MRNTSTPIIESIVKQFQSTLQADFLRFREFELEPNMTQTNGPSLSTLSRHFSTEEQAKNWKSNSETAQNIGMQYLEILNSQPDIIQRTSQLTGQSNGVQIAPYILRSILDHENETNRDIPTSMNNQLRNGSMNQADSLHIEYRDQNDSSAKKIYLDKSQDPQGYYANICNLLVTTTAMSDHRSVNPNHDLTMNLHPILTQTLIPLQNARLNSLLTNNFPLLMAIRENTLTTEQAYRAYHDHLSAHGNPHHNEQTAIAILNGKIRTIHLLGTWLQSIVTTGISDDSLSCPLRTEVTQEEAYTLLILLTQELDMIAETIQQNTDITQAMQQMNSTTQTAYLDWINSQNSQFRHILNIHTHGYTTQAATLHQNEQASQTHDVGSLNSENEQPSDDHNRLEAENQQLEQNCNRLEAQNQLLEQNCNRLEAQNQRYHRLLLPQINAITDTLKKTVSHATWLYKAAFRRSIGLGLSLIAMSLILQGLPQLTISIPMLGKGILSFTVKILPGIASIIGGIGVGIFGYAFIQRIVNYWRPSQHLSVENIIQNSDLLNDLLAPLTTHTSTMKTSREHVNRNTRQDFAHPMRPRTNHNTHNMQANMHGR